MAALLGVSEDAIKKRLERARSVLKAAVLERFATAIRRTAPGATFTTIVIAALALSPKHAVAATGATAKKLGAAHVMKGGLATTIAGIVAGLVAVTALASWILSKDAPGGGPPTSRAVSGAALAAQRDAGSSTEAASAERDGEISRYPRAIRDRTRRDEVQGRILATLERGDAHPVTALASERGQRETNDVEQFGRFLAQAIREDFVPMARECAKQLAGRRPGIHGTATVAFELLGDARIGGVVNSAEVERAQSTLLDAEFETCIRESLYGVY